MLSSITSIHWPTRWSAFSPAPLKLSQCMDCVGHTSSTMVGVSAESAFTCWLVRKGRTKPLSPMRLSQFVGRISGDFVLQNLALAEVACSGRYRATKFYRQK